MSLIFINDYIIILKVEGKRRIKFSDLESSIVMDIVRFKIKSDISIVF